MKRAVLIVEDSPAMRHLLVLTIRRLQAEVTEAADGLEALKLLSQKRFDLVFVDLNMPVLDGMKLIKRVHEDGALAETQVCVVTTEASAETEAQARALGARFFLRKPIHRSDVERVLAEAFPGG